MKKKIKKIKNRIRPSKSEVTRLLGDSKKFIKLTKWSPKINFDDGLTKTIDWIKSSKINLKNSSRYIV